MVQNNTERAEAFQGTNRGSFLQKESAEHTALSAHQGETEQAARTEVSQEMHQDEVDALLEELGKEARKRATRRKWIIGSFLTYVGLMLALAIATHKFTMMGNIGSMTGLIAAASAATRGQKKIAHDLAQYKDDVRVAGPLAEALEFQDKSLLPVVSEVLIQLLPQLKASDKNRLNAEQRACLYRALRGKDVALSLAILQSLRQIGDSKALPYVQKLAEDQRAMGRNPQLRTEIESCLPFLNDLAEREKNSQTLLRAADGNITSRDVLLRPAAGSAPATAPDQLLRPTETPDV